MKQLFNPITATVWKGGHGASSSICPTKQAVHCVPIIPYRLQCVFGILISLIFFFTTVPLFAGNIPAPKNVRVIKHHPGFYVFIGGDIQYALNAIADNPDFIGIKKVYHWRDLEPSKGVYDFSEIISDLAELQAEGKRLWVQVSVTTWSSGVNPHTPQYMWSDPKYNGALPYYGVYERLQGSGGWIPIFWETEVQDRFRALNTALGARFNNESYFEGIVLGETSIGRPPGDQFGYNVPGILAGFKTIALAMKTAFPDKSFIHMINFAPFDREEFGAWCVSNGIGIGCPDFVINNPDNSIYTIVYPMMKDTRNVVYGGPDVQWLDYEKINPEAGKYCTAAELLDASIDLVDPWYFFWEKREPYFSRDVIPAIREFHKNGGNLGHK